jgi:hypothetical protein
MFYLRDLPTSSTEHCRSYADAKEIFAQPFYAYILNVSIKIIVMYRMWAG